MPKLSHTDAEGRARMVDVGGKPPVHRLARARGEILMSPEALALVAENRVKKGDVLTVAQVAGIQAAKRAGDLIPLCHPLPLDHVDVRAEVADGRVVVTSEARCVGRTGVEMEALTAVAVALLTVYDMCKAVDRNMRIGDIALVDKEKGDVPLD